MGLLSWLFPSPEQRLETARALLAAGRFRDARDELAGIEGPEAERIAGEAADGLVRLNLAAVIEWAESGENERVATHLALAEELHRGGLENEFRDARRRLREIRTARAEEAARKEAEAARAAAVDPLGLVGRGLLERPSAGPDLSPDAEERRQRLALAVEQYPEELRERAVALGPAFADAVLDLDDGRPDLALAALLTLPDDDPCVCFERARCAWALGDAEAAARMLRAFAARFGRHAAVGPEHTGVWLAQALARTGDPEGAIRVLREVGATDPAPAAFPLAQLLFATAPPAPDREARLADAEGLLVGVVRQFSRAHPAWLLLAEVRIARGQRMDAMRALEMSMQACCEVPGKCGYQPPDADVMRLLATLYLEDGLERDRALELVDRVRASTEAPGWEDAYLLALASRARGEADADDVAGDLWDRTPPDDPRRDRLERFLPLPA